MSGKYKMGTIARMTGFSPTLLRAWERRYGLLVPERTEGGHRLYTEADFRVLERVRSWLERGRSIGECARAGRDSLLSERQGTMDTPSSSQLGHQAAETLGRLSQEIVCGAEDIDGNRIAAALDQAFALVPPDRAIEEVVLPSLQAIGISWAEGNCSISGEHLASLRIRSRILHLLEAARGGQREIPPVVFSCFPGEDHELGILILGYYFARVGYNVQILGSDLPLWDLAGTVNRLRPQGVCLSVSRWDTFVKYRASLLEMNTANLGDTVFLLGGQGVPEQDPELEAAGVRLFPPSERSVRQIAASMIESMT